MCTSIEAPARNRKALELRLLSRLNDLWGLLSDRGGKCETTLTWLAKKTQKIYK